MESFICHSPAQAVEEPGVDLDSPAHTVYQFASELSSHLHRALYSKGQAHDPRGPDTSPLPIGRAHKSGDFFAHSCQMAPPGNENAQIFSS